MAGLVQEADFDYNLLKNLNKEIACLTIQITN
jgi:hypothetical protein